MRKLASPIGWLLFLFASSVTASAADAVFFSDKPKLVAPLLASLRDPQIKIAFLRTEQRSFFEPAFGGDLGFYYQELSEDGKNKISLMVRGMVAPRFEFNSDSFDLWNTDFIGGPQLAYQRDQNVFELWLFHESSHKGPDMEDKTKKNFSFESVRFLYSRIIRPGLRLYTGPEIVVHSSLKDLRYSLSLHAGAEWHLENCPSLYFAGDFESKQVYGWTLNNSFQVGYDLGSPSIQRRQRFFLNFYHGYSPQGQFSKDRETSFSFGFAMTY